MCDSFFKREFFENGLSLRRTHSIQKVGSIPNSILLGKKFSRCPPREPFVRVTQTMSPMFNYRYYKKNKEIVKEAAR